MEGKRSIHAIIISAAAREAGVTIKQAQAFTKAYLTGVKAALVARRSVRIRNFGDFFVKRLAPLARKGGILGPVNAPARDVVRFKSYLDLPPVE